MPTIVLPHFLQSAFLPSSIMKFVSRSFHHRHQKLGWNQENTSAQADQISIPSLLFISQSRTCSKTRLSNLIYSLLSSQAKGKPVFRVQSENRFSHRDSSQYKVRPWMQKSQCNLDVLLINTTAHFKPQPLAAQQLLLASNLWALFGFVGYFPHPIHLFLTCSSI